MYELFTNPRDIPLEQRVAMGVAFLNQHAPRHWASRLFSSTWDGPVLKFTYQCYEYHERDCVLARAFFDHSQFVCRRGFYNRNEVAQYLGLISPGNHTKLEVLGFWCTSTAEERDIAPIWEHAALANMHERGYAAPLKRPDPKPARHWFQQVKWP